jgi:predicted Fe-Mo cluster-binding NifX family protein
MRIAIPDWKGRVSPVFDSARYLRLVDAPGGAEPFRKRGLVRCNRCDRARQLSELGVGCLVCGAISRSLQAVIEAKGIRVVPHACGPVMEVLEAFIDRAALHPRLLMPGCVDNLAIPSRAR